MRFEGNLFSWVVCIGFLGLLVFGWPASGWTIIALSVHWLFDKYASNLQRTPNGRARKIAESIGRAISKIALWLATGIACVAIAQILLLIFPLPPELVWSSEERMRDAYHSLEGYLSLKVLLIALALAV